MAIVLSKLMIKLVDCQNMLMWYHDLLTGERPARWRWGDGRKHGVPNAWQVEHLDHDIFWTINWTSLKVTVWKMYTLFVTFEDLSPSHQNVPLGPISWLERKHMKTYENIWKHHSSPTGWCFCDHTSTWPFNRSSWPLRKPSYRPRICSSVMYQTFT